ncbi:AAA family ATPase [Candidatus Micrarchaeota archaeon]|nr:AAA family ATPase [Candidatus Micrarchaeota archaeon]
MKRFSRIIVTGTPGTGKTSVGGLVAKELGLPFVEANAIVRKEKLWARKPEVNLAKLRKRLSREWGVIEGHLLCEFSIPGAVVLVLRCNPRVLEKRLAKRNYSRRKLKTNLEAEAIDYCMQRAEQEYGPSRIIQVDCTRLDEKACAKRCLRVLAGKREQDCPDFSGWLYGPNV